MTENEKRIQRNARKLITNRAWRAAHPESKAMRRLKAKERHARTYIKKGYFKKYHTEEERASARKEVVLKCREKFRQFHNAKARDKRAQNLESHRERGRKWMRNNRVKCRVYEHAKRARKKLATVGNQKLILEWERSWRGRKTSVCFWCRDSIKTSACHTDHIVAIVNGGPHSIENLCVSCGDCNRSKNARSLSEWNKTLKEPALL